jgi:two-component system, NarL family, nitrate/nitrite response regulator NarL
MEETKIHILIADDHVLFIDGLVLLLKDVSNISIVDVANDGKELMDILRHQHPDIILLDINMPKLNGLDATRYIRQSYPKIRIIILSTYNEDHLIKKAKEYGANGYLIKNCDKEELLQAIRLVKSGNSCFPYRKPETQSEFSEKDILLKNFKLTAREMEIVNLIKLNFTNQQIAEKLSLSIYTIETHRKNIMHKLGLKKPSELIRFMIEKNL